MVSAITWVGSHNLSDNSLRQADETILQLEDSSVFDAFRANFRNVRDAPDIRSIANGAAATCD
jgi:phosphatidylserine/phosphatidylglycerophosphate/cardiolipin synthase-like enzyme